MHEHWFGGANSGKPAHERWDHWIPKCAGTVVVVGTAVSARHVRGCVSDCSETEQGDTLRCQNAEQTCRASQKHSRNGHRHSSWCRELGNLIRCLLRRRWFRERWTRKIAVWFSLVSLALSWIAENWTIWLEHNHQLAKFYHQKSFQINIGSRGIRCFWSARIKSMISAFVDGSAHGSKLSEERREGELEKASTCFHWQQLGKHNQERRWTEPRQEVSSCPCSEKDSERWIIHRCTGCRHTCKSQILWRRRWKRTSSSHSSQSCVSTCGQENICEQNKHRECLVLPRNEFQLLLTRIWRHCSRFCLFIVNICDSSFVDFFVLVQHSHISLFLDVSIVLPCGMRMVWELLKSLFKCKLHHGWTWTKLHTLQTLQALICSMWQNLKTLMIRSSCWISMIILDSSTQKLCRYPILIKLLHNARDLFAWSVFYSADRRYHHVTVWGRHSSVRESE